jgi:hypothetical protein
MDIGKRSMDEIHDLAGRFHATRQRAQALRHGLGDLS